MLPDDGRHRRRLHRLRPAHQPHRPLQGLPRPRLRALRGGHVAAVPAGAGHRAPRSTASGWPSSASASASCMPVLILAVQNSVRPADLGTATSANNYFRQIGGSVGAAIFGTLFADRLADAARRPAARTSAPAARPRVHHPATGARAARPAARQLHRRRTRDAMPRIFLYLVPVLVLGLLLAFFLKEKPLVSHASTLRRSRPQARRRPADPPPSPAGARPAAPTAIRRTPCQPRRTGPPSAASRSAAPSSTTTAASCRAPRSPSSTSPASRSAAAPAATTGGTR